jgi:glucan biosynthesis protein
MAFHIYREKLKRTFEPTMEEMVEKTLQILKKNPKGFFLLVEGNTRNYYRKNSVAFHQRPSWNPEIILTGPLGRTI